MLQKKTFAIKAAAALFLTGSLLFTASCTSNQSANDGYSVAQPDGNDYSFSYPDVWEVLRSDSMYAIQSQDKAANISISCFGISLESFNLESFSSAETPYSALLDEYVNAENHGYIALLKDNFGENVSITEIQECTVGERAGKRIIYHMKVGEDSYYFATVLSILPTVGETYVYALTYTASSEEAFDEHIAVFDGVVSSFKFN